MKIRPTFSDALNNLGCALRRREPGIDDAMWHRRLEEAAKCFDMAIRCKPEHADAHSNLALTLWDLQQPEAAVEHFQEALRLRPDHLDARAAYSLVLFEMAQACAEAGQAQSSGGTSPGSGQQSENRRPFGPAQRRGARPAGPGRTRAGKAQGGGRRAGHGGLGAGDQSQGCHAQRPQGRAPGLGVARETGGRDPQALDTLAAAYAEVGDFPKAMGAGVAAFKIATQQGETRLAVAIGARLELYRQGKPFRDERPEASEKTGGM